MWPESIKLCRGDDAWLTATLRSGFPLSNRLLREMHEILLATGRGAHKAPSEFRQSQNWIGGTRPGNAAFVPPPPQDVQHCMGELEKFLHSDTPSLVKAALAHLQFETIHPFLDGSTDCIGRLLDYALAQLSRGEYFASRCFIRVSTSSKNRQSLLRRTQRNPYVGRLRALGGFLQRRSASAPSRRPQRDREYPWSFVKIENRGAGDGAHVRRPRFC